MLMSHLHVINKYIPNHTDTAGEFSKVIIVIHLLKQRDTFLIPLFVFFQTLFLIFRESLRVLILGINFILNLQLLFIL